MNFFRMSVLQFLSRPVFGAFFVLACLFLAGCDDDSSVGINAFDTNNIFGTIQTDTVKFPGITDQETFAEDLSTLSGTRLFVGQNGNYQFQSIVQFSTRSAIRDSSIVLTSRLTFSGAGSYGESQQPVVLSFYRILSEWNASELEFPELVAGEFYESTPFRTISVPRSSEFSQISFKIPKSLVQSWVNAQPGTTETNFNNGILIRASGQSNIQALYSNNATSSLVFPVLTVSFFEIENGASTVLDSVTLSPSSDFYLYNRDKLSQEPLDPDFLYVGAGGPFTSFLKFDISHISRRGTINRATLQLTVDYEDSDDPLQQSNRSLFGTSDDLLELQAVGVESDLWAPGESVSLLSVSEFQEFESRLNTNTSETRRSIDGNRFEATVTMFVQAWVSDKFENHGFRIQAASPSSDLFRVKIPFFNTTDDVSPKLIITYTTP